MEGERQEPLVQVIVPARNEKDCIAACLQSLVAQQGIAFEINVADDGSTDRTRAIAESFPGVRVISVAEPVSGQTGKCNALICGASGARAEWLLFTDADTIHAPSSLAAAVKDARERGLDLLSYSPQQQTVTWGEKMLMPVVFGELARVFPPSRINDPADQTAAANGQYILVRREVYEKLGGHRTVAKEVVEDVELARLFKKAGCKIEFHHGAGRVQTRMYRSFSGMLEGWTKNLALLFRHPLGLAMMRALEFSVMIGSLVLAASLIKNYDFGASLVCLLGFAVLYASFAVRIRCAGFPWRSSLPAVFGLPLFSFLLLRSYRHWHGGAVTWKGRIYAHSEPRTGVGSSIQEKISEG
jgi:glycosyltransferase involved in cell wall biosynthesis